MEKIAKAAPMSTKKKDMDLERKSVAELKELLEKQEKLLLDKNLIKSLPDHGKKIAMFIEKIQKSLDLRNNSVDDVADKLKRMQLGYTSDERIDYANSYEFVINQNSDAKMKRHPKKFVPNRLTKDKKDNSSRPELSNVNGSSVDVQKTTAPTSVDRKSGNSTTVTTTSTSTNENSQPQTITQMDEGNETERRLKNKYDASLEETFLYDRKHAHGAQLISIQEGMNLLKHHHTALQEAEMKRAEAMLAASCSTKLSTDLSSWRGERFNTYRDEPVASHGEENDDDDDDSDKDNEIIAMKSSSDDDGDGVD